VFGGGATPWRGSIEPRAQKIFTLFEVALGAESGTTEVRCQSAEWICVR
jgi:hypothetical protein